MTKADLGVRGVAVGAEDEEVAARSVGVRQDVVHPEDFVCGGQAARPEGLAAVHRQRHLFTYIQYIYIYIYIYIYLYIYIYV